VETERFSIIPAAHVYLIRDGQVLLQQRQNTGYLDGMWVAGAAGHIELGETATAAAAREAREEIGVLVDPYDLDQATVMQRTDGTGHPREQRADWFFTVPKWSGEPSIREPHKCADLRWFALEALPAEVPPYERFVLEHLARDDLKAFTSFGFSEQLR
jgi:8-oxo-dGTP pyrophosphatase MutT (NUDIX family)